MPGRKAAIPPAYTSRQNISGHRRLSDASRQTRHLRNALSSPRASRFAIRLLKLTWLLFSFGMLHFTTILIWPC